MTASNQAQGTTVSLNNNAESSEENSEQTVDQDLQSILNQTQNYNPDTRNPQGDQTVSFLSLTGYEWILMQEFEKRTAIEDFLKTNHEEKYDVIITDEIVEEYSEVLMNFSNESRKFEIMEDLQEHLDYNGWIEKIDEFYAENVNDEQAMYTLVIEVLADAIKDTIEHFLDKKREERRRRYQREHSYYNPYSYYRW